MRLPRGPRPLTSAPARSHACAGDDNDAHVRVAIRIEERGVPLIDHLRSKGIHALRPVERDGGDVVRILVDDLLEVHVLLLGAAAVASAVHAPPRQISSRR
jgi:hypothetical protein